MNNLVACTYRNLETYPQILRIAEARAYFERTVFPNQCISFQASPNSLVEIHDHVTCLPSDNFTCEELRAISVDSIRQFQAVEVAWFSH